MKKYIALVVSMLFVLGFAASAFAIHAEIPSETQAVVAKGQVQVTLGGEVRVRGEIRNNTVDFNSDGADYRAAYDERVRLSLEAKVTPNTMGMIQLESGAGLDNADAYTWGTSTAAFNAAGTGIYPRGNSKRGDLRIIQAWLQTTGSGLLGIPAGLKVGHMPLALGNGLFFDHTKYGDDAIVVFMDPTKELHIGLLTVKFAEGNAAANGTIATQMNDDADAYVGLAVYKPSKDTSVSFDITYVNEQLFGITSASGVAIANDGTGLWNFGLRGNTAVSGLGIKADLELQGGKSKQIGAADIKHKGYAGLLSLSYKMDPVTLVLEGAIGSGDDDATDTKNKTFVTALGADQHYTYVYEYRAATAAGATGTGLANTTYVKLGGSMDLTKDLSALLNGYWLRSTKDVVNGAGENTKALGAEVDAKVTYKIDKNLNYWVEGGYLFAGKAYDGATKASDNAYAVRHGIQLNF